MNENINLCKILKGHESETFYSPAFGKIRLETINDDNFKDYPIYCHNDFTDYYFTNDGRYAEDGELSIFPSKNQRDWNKWAEEQKSKTPKTWNSIKNNNTEVKQIVDQYNGTNSIIRSSIALMKIHQLIEVGYGNNPTNKEWDAGYWKYAINIDRVDNIYITCTLVRCPIAFHTKEQAEEFISYPDNVQLIKDFYMI